jgi:hypothetical protein
MSMPGGVRGGDREESPYSIVRRSLCVMRVARPRERRQRTSAAERSRRGGSATRQVKPFCYALTSCRWNKRPRRS